MNREELIVLNNKTYLFRRITLADKLNVMNLYNKCKEYFILTEGRAAENCEDFFSDLPPNKKIEDKYLYGVFDNKLLIGVIDLVANYPVDGEWIIGLLLLDPATRRLGFGEAIHSIIKSIVRTNGAKKLRIGVVEQNNNALKFWHKMGYKQIKIIEQKKFGIKESKILVMNYYL